MQVPPTKNELHSAIAEHLHKIMNMLNTKTVYLRILEYSPYMAQDLQNLIKAVILDCRNNTNQAFADMESNVQNIGRRTGSEKLAQTSEG